ncbi:MAG: type II toxin-antitoxin system RelE/ParE family toxin [Gemmatimonadetes bacterium]|nr:type II toxin-antitoxin system RelE/ParE family toxin [Gemmatimonadota bacterium]MYG86834.1 type II toxin-antitoxin system RelE/ParE family toxin [Gemmatimonadota bacterium]MYJ90191.1 type II toxin-antitoxin system RelE/ParE family toxin [Gemmatimonadota bacterium]
MQRIVNYLDKRAEGPGDPRNTGRALVGPLGKLWRYRIGDSRVICDIQTGALRVLVIRVGRRD